jgi:23S rRNA pseudouridine1911/1915/1917 synthase
VAGDLDYGGAAAALAGLDRHFLHAWKIGFERPEGGRVEVQSPLPPDLVRVLAALEPAGS